MTPPVDEDETNEEGRRLEAKARKGLEDDGCPPCYPSELEIPLRNREIPQEFRAIVKYWISELRGDDVVLCAQASDWRGFRKYQLNRCQYRKKHFDEFIDKIRERRRRHGLSDDIRLLPDPRQQGRLENWIEFEDYHLKKLEQTEAERDQRKQMLEDNRRLSRDMNISECERERARKNAEILEYRSESDEFSIERHKVLLHWVDQQRQTMDSTSSHEEVNTGHKYNLRTSARGNRRQISKASTTIGQAKITKVKPKKRSRLTQKLKQSEISIPQIYPSGETTAQFNTSVKPLIKTQRRGTSSVQSAETPESRHPPTSPRSQVVPEITKTRSGRISRPSLKQGPKHPVGRSEGLTKLNARVGRDRESHENMKFNSCPRQ